MPLYVVGTGIEGGWIPRKWEPKKIYSWNMWQWENFYHKSPASKKPIQLDKTPLVIGAQMCAWEQTDEGEIPSLRRRVPPFVERIWNTDYKLPYEEFYTKNEEVDLKRHKALGVVINLKPRPISEIETLLIKFDEAFTKATTTKESIVKIMKDFLVNFDHNEKGKTLDSKM